MSMFSKYLLLYDKNFQSCRKLLNWDDKLYSSKLGEINVTINSLDSLLIFSTFFLNSGRKKQYGQIAKFEIPIK